MESFLADVRLAWRVLLKSPGFTMVAIAALALGIGANTALFSVVNTVLLQPLSYPESDRIMGLVRTYKTGQGWSTSIPKFAAWRKCDGFDSIAVYDFAGPGLNLGGGDRPEQVKGIHVSLDYFKVFGVSPVIGRAFTAEEDRPGGPRVAVLSNSIWKSRFAGDLSVIGRSLTLNSEPYTVVGIMPPGFIPEPETDIWIPLQPDLNTSNQGHYLRCAGRLKAGASIPAVRAQLKTIGDQFRQANPKNMGEDESAGMVPIQEMTVHDVRPALMILLGAVGFVLLIACANVANLLLARASGRQREVAIRTAIGATRMRIVRQLLTESVLLSGTAGILGLAGGIVGVKALLALSPGNIPRVTAGADGSVALALDWRVFAFTAVVALLTGILFGVLPALQISRVDLNTTLKETGGRSGTSLKHNRTRNLLVIAEVALAVVLLTGAGLLIQTFAQLRNVKPGIDAHNVLTMRTSLAGGRYSKTAEAANFTRQVIQRIESLPGVEAVASTWLLPMEGSVDMGFDIEGKPAAKPGDPNGDEEIVYTTPHYFSAFRIALLRGRLIEEGDHEKSAAIMLISDAFAKKYFDKSDPIGQRITIGRGGGPEMEDVTRQIVGVVSDVRQNGLAQPAPPLMYIPASQVPDGLMKLASSVVPISWVIRTTSDPSSIRQAVQREVLAVDSQMPVSRMRTMELNIGESLARQNFNMLLLTIFAAIALVLASIGIYGLMAYTVEQRRHEIGIRIALGASRQEMLRLILGKGTRLTLGGVAVGLAASFGLTRLLAAMLYGVKATDPVTFVTVGVVLGLIAILACYIPAQRATRVDPVIALRYE